MADQKIVFRFLNVGQGDATHIVLPGGEHVLVDMNLDHKHHGIDVVEFLSDELPEGEEKKRLAYLVNTHPHDDHIRGMGGLGNHFEIGEMWHSGHERDLDEGENDSYDKFRKLVEDLGDDAREVCAGSEPWAAIDGVTFHILRPSSKVKDEDDMTAEERREAIHNECMALKVSYAGRAVILTGDSNRAAWESIVKHYDTDGLLAADVLHASHHGSRTFFKKCEDDEPYTAHLDTMDPDYVVISVGANNGHDHPHEDALGLYRDGGRAVYRTDENLTVVLTIDENRSMTWEMDDEDFQAKYQLPDPDEDEQDDEDSDDERALAASKWGTAVISRTRLGDSSPTA
jgi:competence protein ComEC